MAKRKDLIITGFIQDILFKTDEEVKSYIHRLEHRKTHYKILEELKREDGTVIIRIQLQYITTPLIQLYNED